MMMEERSEGCSSSGFECGGGGQDPRTAGALQKLEKTKKQILPPERNTALATPRFQPREV